MEPETLKLIAMILSFLMGTLGFLRFIRSDYEKKIHEIEKTMSQCNHNYNKQLQDHRKQIHNVHIRHAEIQTLTQCIKETIEKIDKKIDHLHQKIHQEV